MMQPLFVQSRSAPFKDRFNNAEATAISSMNDNGDDIASQAPLNKIDIQKVGLVRHNIPVTIAHPFDGDKSNAEHARNGNGCGGKEKLTVYCEVKVQTCVPASVRGVHMSRMNNHFAAASLGKYETLLDYARQLASSITDSHFGGPTHVSVSTTVPIFAHVKGWKSEKDKVSLDHVGMSVDVEYRKTTEEYQDNGRGDQWKMGMGVTVNHITACPCVQKTFAHAADLHHIPFPLLTHSQRTTSSVSLHGINAAVDLVKLLQSVDAVVHRVHNTLPREYELAKVHDAHLRPQFAEDVVRDVAVSVLQTFKTDPIIQSTTTHTSSLPDQRKIKQSMVKVKSVSAESIHDFDIVAEIEAEF